jgi:ribosomal protein S18 acetylase RimI-like enzyme
VTADHSMLYLRSAEALDVPSLARLRVASLIELGVLAPADARAFEIRARDELRVLFRDDRIAAWLAVDDGAMVGCASVVFWTRLPYPRSSLHAEIAGVYVLPEHRGAGLATELTREVVAAARARGVRKIVLHPSALAEPLYRRLGFVDGNELVLAPPGTTPSRC